MFSFKVVCKRQLTNCLKSFFGKNCDESAVFMKKPVLFKNHNMNPNKNIWKECHFCVYCNTYVDKKEIWLSICERSSESHHDYSRNHTENIKKNLTRLFEMSFMIFLWQIWSFFQAKDVFLLIFNERLKQPVKSLKNFVFVIFEYVDESLISILYLQISSFISNYLLVLKKTPHFRRNFHNPTL